MRQDDCLRLVASNAVVLHDAILFASQDPEALAIMLIYQDNAHAVLAQFDRSIVDSLAQNVSAKANLKADLKTYKFFDNVWQFDLENITFRLSTHNQDVTVDRARLICIDQKMMGSGDLV